MSKEWREFWVKGSYAHEIEVVNSIRVIEFGAYEEQKKIADIEMQQNAEMAIKLVKAIEALKKYGNLENWCDSRDSYQHIVFMEGDDIERIFPENKKSKNVMGRTARETLKELGEL